MSEIELTDQDPTIWYGCRNCNRMGLGLPVGNYYSIAYSPKQVREAKRNSTPFTCPNCSTELTFIREVNRG